jgi:CoA-transferase family III
MMKRILLAVESYAGRIAATSARIGARVEIGPEVLDRSDTNALQPPGQTSSNRSARMVRAGDGWLAVNLPRQSDWELIPAWLHEDADDWTDVARYCARQTTRALLEQAHVLGLAVTMVGETPGLLANQQLDTPQRRDATTAVRVVDLSALWAGPLCAALLAKAGADVVKIEDRRRPDPTPAPLSRRLNQAKRKAVFDFSEPEGRRALQAELLAADVIVTSARPRAFQHLGVAPAVLFALKPRLLWVAITAHGWSGQHRDRIGFGDDTAAAGRLVDWHDGEPAFVGDAVADPLTGLAAAAAALEAISCGRCGILDVALASTAAAAASQC